MAPSLGAADEAASAAALEDAILAMLLVGIMPPGSTEGQTGAAAALVGGTFPSPEASAGAGASTYRTLEPSWRLFMVAGATRALAARRVMAAMFEIMPSIERA